MLAPPADAARRLRAAVRDLQPQLHAATPAIDRDRCVPPAVTAVLRAAGVYRMFVPAELGGDQVDLQTFLDVVEIVSAGNGAAGWDLATSSVGTLLALLLPPVGIRAIYGTGPDVCFAGTAGALGGRATATEGGYRVSGRWRFGSGRAEADWMAGVCRVLDGDALRLGATGVTSHAAR